MLVKGHVAGLVRVVVHMNPRRSQLDAPESGFKQRLKDDETGMGIHAADIHGIAASVRGGGYTADRPVVFGAAVGGRKGERDARKIAGLVEHLEQVGVHLLHARAAPAFAAELDRGEVAQGKNSHKKLLIFGQEHSISKGWGFKGLFECFCMIRLFPFA